jgi:hypothetical protein
MRKIITVLMGIAVLAACSDDDPTDTPQQFTWTTEVEGLTGFEEINGDASARWTEETTSFTATAELLGDEAGSVRPWHVHLGTCGSNGGIVGGVETAYPRLTASAAGTDTVTVTIPVALDPDQDYYVNYHNSVADLGTIIACGNLDR